MRQALRNKGNRRPVKQQKRQKKKTKSSKVENSLNVHSGWNTTDEEEIKRRILRAETEPMKVRNLEPKIPYFSNYTVQSKTAQSYFVEILSLSKYINSCSCTDYDISGLGTCKHIEKVFLTLQKKGKSSFKVADRTGSPKAEIYMDPADYQVKLA